MNEIDPIVNELPRVAEFYSGRSIFLTGFTGFLGKATVEKLLWSCPDIKAIYVLLRGKRGASFQERINKIIKSDCFDRLANSRPEAFKKIIGIQGDVLLPGLGISEEDRCKIISDVSIVIHSAASVKFDDPLTYAMDINFMGTKSMLDLATTIPQLKVFAYVSTAYSNCDRINIEEKLYEPHADWSDMLKIRNKVDETTINILSAKCCDNLPNTYVFSKSVTEHMVNDYSRHFPVIIFRPSIVINSNTEPTSGWIENLNGPTAIFLGYNIGIIRTSYVNDEFSLDVIPCDAIVRYLLWVILLKPYQREGVTSIYNASANEYRKTGFYISRMGFKCFERNPVKYLLWMQSAHFTNNYLYYYVKFMIYQLLPALLIDLVLMLLGNKPRLFNLQRKIFVAMASLNYFIWNSFVISNDRMQILQKHIHPDDFEEHNYTFYNDKKFDNDEYFYGSHLYNTKHFLKQSPDDHKIARRNFNLYKLADAVVKSGFYMLSACLIYKYEVVQTLISSTINYVINF